MCVETPGTNVGSPTSESRGAMLKSPVRAIGLSGFAVIQSRVAAVRAVSQSSL